MSNCSMKASQRRSEAPPSFCSSPATLITWRSCCTTVQFHSTCSSYLQNIPALTCILKLLNKHLVHFCPYLSQSKGEVMMSTLFLWAGDSVGGILFTDWLPRFLVFILFRLISIPVHCDCFSNQRCARFKVITAADGKAFMRLNHQW